MTARTVVYNSTLIYGVDIDKFCMISTKKNTIQDESNSIITPIIKKKYVCITWLLTMK